MFTGDVLHAQPELRVSRSERVLMVRTHEPHACLSFAPLSGGDCVTDVVANHSVHSSELPLEVDALALLRARHEAHVGPTGVAMMTACGLEHAELASAHERGHGMGAGASDVRALAVATVGLSNLLRAGDTPGALAPVNTINVIVWVSAPLSFAARLEALTLATEARTLAMLEAGLPSRRSGLPASGTGTDCFALLSPVAPPTHAALYAGKHTAVGAVIGRAVHASVSRGVASWCQRHGDELQRAMAAHFRERP